jgi:hypothetical protein
MKFKDVKTGQYFLYNGDKFLKLNDNSRDNALYCELNSKGWFHYDDEIDKVIKPTYKLYIADKLSDIQNLDIFEHSEIKNMTTYMSKKQFILLIKKPQ